MAAILSRSQKTYGSTHLFPISETVRFSDVLRGYRNKGLGTNGLKLYNSIETIEALIIPTSDIFLLAEYYLLKIFLMNNYLCQVKSPSRFDVGQWSSG